MQQRPVTQIHEIELSSRCNLACVYCPHPKMRRAKLDMGWATFDAALRHVEYYCKQGTQGELALTGIGEALLHPDFVEMLLKARSVIGPKRLLTFSTNGLLLTREIIDAVKSANPMVFVSLHRPEAAAPAVERLRLSGLRYGTNAAFVTSALNWVGDVNWHVSHARQTCEYLRSGWAVIRADGNVGTCCWDAETAESEIGHVSQSPGTLVTAPHSACGRCSLAVPMELLEERQHA